MNSSTLATSPVFASPDCTPRAIAPRVSSGSRPAYLHSVYRANGAARRVWLGDAFLEFTIGNPRSCSRRTARLIAARELHKENVFQSRVRAAMAAGHSQFAAECIAAAAV